MRKQTKQESQVPQLPLQVGNDLVLLLEGFSLIFESLVLCLNDPVLFPEGLGGLPGLFLEGLPNRAESMVLATFSSSSRYLNTTS